MIIYNKLNDICYSAYNIKELLKELNINNVDIIKEFNDIRISIRIIKDKLDDKSISNAFDYVSNRYTDYMIDENDEFIIINDDKSYDSSDE